HPSDLSQRTSFDEQTAVRPEALDLRIERLLLGVGPALTLLLGERGAVVAVTRVGARLRRRTGAEPQLTVVLLQLGKPLALLLLDDPAVTPGRLLCGGDLLSARLDRLADPRELREQIVSVDSVQLRTGDPIVVLGDRRDRTPLDLTAHALALHLVLDRLAPARQQLQVLTHVLVPLVALVLAGAVEHAGAHEDRELTLGDRNDHREAAEPLPEVLRLVLDPHTALHRLVLARQTPEELLIPLRPRYAVHPAEQRGLRSLEVHDRRPAPRAPRAEDAEEHAATRRRADHVTDAHVLPDHNRLAVVPLPRDVLAAHLEVRLVRIRGQSASERLREQILTRAALAEHVEVHDRLRRVPVREEVAAQLLEVRQVTLREVDRGLLIADLPQRERTLAHGLKELAELGTAAALRRTAAHRHVRVQLPAEVEVGDDAPTAVLVLAGLARL